LRKRIHSQKQDYKSKYFFHYNKDLSITVAKVQKNELSEEKELFFYTKSRIYYTNLIILQKKQSKKFFVYAYHHISPFEGGRGDVC